MKKKLILAIAIITINCNIIFAQGDKYDFGSSDGFFSTSNWNDSRKTDNMPNIIEYNTRSDSVPVGNACLLLAGLGIAYGMMRRLMTKD